MNKVFPVNADLTILLNGEPLGGVTDITTDTSASAKYCREILTDEPWASYSESEENKIILTIFTAAAPDFGRDFELSVISNSSRTVYRGCNVNAVSFTRDTSGGLNCRVEIVSAEKEVEQLDE